METAVFEHKVRSIGLSNFEESRLDDVYKMASIKPTVLQVECHPYYQQKDLKDRIKIYGTILESWYPIAHGDKGLINEPLFTKLADKYHKTNVQIILRWHIQEGNVIFPKTTNPIHLRDNAKIFDFELTAGEMNAVRKLSKNIGFYNGAKNDEEAFLKWIIKD